MREGHLVKRPKNGTVPETGQSQKRDSPKNGTVPETVLLKAIPQ